MSIIKGGPVAREKTVTFISSGELRIEGLLSQPEEPGPHPAAVICHPHPQFGGDMQNNVVTGVAKALLMEKIITLRFNFRGVGSSEGNYGDGEGETEDVKGALDFLVSLPFVNKTGLFIMGYSFGAWVGLKAAHERKDLSGLVGISPPLSMYGFEFLEGNSSPKLLIFGDRDFVCPVESAKAFSKTLSEPKKMELITGADHFLLGCEDRIGAVIADFIMGICTNKG
jgi:alpha/beta superfamily hydrolase